MLQADKNYIQGTSARKIQYNVYEENKVLKEKKNRRNNNRAKLKVVAFTVLIFALSCVLMYRYALITELNYKVNKLHTQHNEIINDNTRLKVKIENEIDLNKVREVAETKLGMHKPDKHQIVYLKVPKNDFTKVSEDLKESPDLASTVMDKVKSFAYFLY